MYRNVGGTMKGCATLLFVIDIIGSVIGGTVIARMFYRGINFFLASVLFAGVGIIVSWLSLMFLYGFGELIESNRQTRDYLKDVRRTLKQIEENQEMLINSNNPPMNQEYPMGYYDETSNAMPLPASDEERTSTRRLRRQE